MSSRFRNFFGFQNYRKLNISMLLSLGILTTDKVKNFLAIQFRSTNENGIILNIKDYNDDEYLDDDNENFEKITLKDFSANNLKIPNLNYSYRTIFTPLGYFQYMIVKEQNKIHIDLSLGKSISQYVNPADDLINELNLKILQRDLTKKFIEI